MPKNVDQQVSITDNFNTDAFGRLRTSSPIAQFEYQNEYNKGPLIWAEKVSGTGSATHVPSTSSVSMTTGGGTDGASVIRQTRQYFRYTSGKSLKIIMTFDCGQCLENVAMKAGYFDGENGIFFMRRSGRNYLVLRSKSSGAVVDTEIPQESWNKDRMDGAGPSGIRLDFERAQIFLADIQWLGVGSVRCGFEYDGLAYYAHEFEHTNEIDNVYMATANLPIRYEIVNLAEATASSSFEQICSTVITEQGSIDDQGYYEHSVNSGITPINVTTRRSVLAIRPKATFGAKINRGLIKHEAFEVVTGGNNVLWELVYNPTLGGTPVWTSAGDNSLVEYDIAGTTVTGGEIVSSGYSLAGTGSTRGKASAETHSKYPMALDVDGGTPPIMALVCTSFTGTATVNASLGFKEYY
jgi:hypothetical protein